LPRHHRKRRTVRELEVVDGNPLLAQAARSCPFRIGDPINEIEL